MPEPPYEKTIVCLANSRRPDGRCFAGKEFANGATGTWIRPINAANRDAISEEDRKYQNGTLADVLDIVTVPMQAPRPHAHHREDHQIRADYYWEQIGRATWQQIVQATDTVAGPLWPIETSSHHGLHDKVSEATVVKQPGSLLLISPTRLDLLVAMESQYNGPDRRRVRASFAFNGEQYNFVVTDPWIEEQYFAGKDGTYHVDSSRLCVSLPEIVGGHSTKLVAAVITPERAA